jgi:hypothetical protein
MPEAHWTPSLVEERFVESADVMRHLPDVWSPDASTPGQGSSTSSVIL